MTVIGTLPPGHQGVVRFAVCRWRSSLFLLSLLCFLLLLLFLLRCSTLHSLVNLSLVHPTFRPTFSCGAAFFYLLCNWFLGALACWVLISPVLSLYLCLSLYSLSMMLPTVFRLLPLLPHKECLCTVLRCLLCLCFSAHQILLRHWWFMQVCLVVLLLECQCWCCLWGTICRFVGSAVDFPLPVER